MIAVSGLRSSWETTALKARRSSSASSRAVTSSITTSVMSSPSPALAIDCVLTSSARHCPLPSNSHTLSACSCSPLAALASEVREGGSAVPRRASYSTEAEGSAAPKRSRP